MLDKLPSLKQIALAFLFLCMPGVAQADQSCNALFDSLRRVATQSPSNFIHVLWTTNYFTANTRFTAETRVRLIAGHGDLAGMAARHQSVAGPDLSKPIERMDEVILRIRADGRIMLNDRYGPFDPVCSHGKFAVITSADSIEVFNFHPVRGSMTDIDAGGPGATVAPPDPDPGKPTNPVTWCEYSAVDGVVRYLEIGGMKFKCPSGVVVADVSKWTKVNENHAYFRFQVAHLGSGVFAKSDVLEFIITIENWADPKTCRVTLGVGKFERNNDYDDGGDWWNYFRNLGPRAATRWYRANEFAHCKDAIWQSLREKLG